MKRRSRALLAIMWVLSLVLGSVSIAFAGGQGGGNPHERERSNGNSTAEISVVFSEDCTDFHVESSKDISFVSINYADDFTYVKYEGEEIRTEDDDTDGDDPDGSDEQDFSHEGDDPIKSIVVKSGTTTLVFNCPEGGGPVEADPEEDPECSDGVDNDGDGKVDHSGANRDPGCESPDDDDERDPAGTCPDEDGDGVCDEDDECPSEAGTPENDGCPEPCPDQDGDGVCDADDECPSEAGTPENDGCPEPCPDQDSDGVCDADDQCPTQPGTPANNGCPQPCPDQDGDGVCDADDQCPSEAGTPENDGCPEPCPDQDSDGVCDADDQCPTQPGTPANNGCPQPCPDQDGDGVCDADDECPTEAGPPENGGCPLDPCTAAAGDPGILTDDTLGQTIWDGGADALSPITEDPDGDGVVTGAIYSGGEDTELEFVTDEVACLGDLLIDESESPVDP